MVAHFLYCGLLPDNVRVPQLLQKGYFSDGSGRNSLTLPGEITVVDMIQVTPVQPTLGNGCTQLYIQHVNNLRITSPSIVSDKLVLPYIASMLL